MDPRRVGRLGGPLLLITLLLAGAAPAEEPAVARPSFPIDGEIRTKGVVFFVPARTGARAAAIGTAHTFELEKLAGVRRGDFVLGHSRRLVASTTGFLIPPGKPFNQPGATLADDYVAYLLDRAPEGVRLLELAAKPTRRGVPVRLLGIPVASPGDEAGVGGRVVEVDAKRIEVELDGVADLRGWGGAPALDADTEQVIGILEATFSRDGKARVLLAPVGRLREALATPLDRGRGRDFAAFAPHGGHAPATARPGTPATRSTRTATTGGVYRQRTGPLIPSPADDGTDLTLEVEYPPQGAVVGDGACGTLVAGRALALQGDLQRFDVMLVIDTSRSTVDPSGADINANGIVGKPHLGRIGSIFDIGSTDPGDSILAAEVAAARQLLRGLDPRSTRVGIVTFAGDPPDVQGGLLMRRQRPPAITLEPLTHEYSRIERGLDTILDRDPEGSTHMAAGVDQATIELLGLRGSLSERDPRSEKIVLFFTDGQPTLPYGPGFDSDNVRAVLRAADRADRANVRIHSFAIGPEAIEGPVATVEMADRTNGFFTPVRDPGDLVDVVEEVSFANLEEVAVENATTHQSAEFVRAGPDGSWAAFLRLDPGRNELRVRARASDGTEVTRNLRISMKKDAPDPPIPPELVPARNRLLEGCLERIKQVRLDAEARRAEQVRKKLLVEIEQERLKARERAAEQRKRLDLEVDPETP